MTMNTLTKGAKDGQFDMDEPRTSLGAETVAVAKRRQLLTHSRQQSFKECRKKHYFGYELAIRPDEDAKALRMGTVYHVALATVANGGTLDEAVEDIRRSYDHMPDEWDAQEWSYECETIIRLLCGYIWRWGVQPLEYIAKERAFELPLLNPATQSESVTWNFAGKIDGVIRLPDARLAVVEHKLLGEDLDPSSSLWRRMRVDHQISLYVIAARRLGHPVESVLYDVTRKPTIKPTPIPSVDQHGIKIVVDHEGNRVLNKDGKSWRQTADTKQGYTLLSRPMTPTEWGNKLTADISERPDFYFARVEIPRLDMDLAECERELWDIQKTMRDAQINDRHYRTCNRNTCSFCSFFEICTTGWTPKSPVPLGFHKVSNLHPELELENSHVERRTALATISAPSASAEAFAAAAS